MSYLKVGDKVKLREDYSLNLDPEISPYFGKVFTVWRIDGVGSVSVEPVLWRDLNTSFFQDRFELVEGEDPYQVHERLLDEYEKTAARSLEIVLERDEAFKEWQRLNTELLENEKRLGVARKRFTRFVETGSAE